MADSIRDLPDVPRGIDRNIVSKANALFETPSKITRPAMRRRQEAGSEAWWKRPASGALERSKLKDIA
ncbi:hypothetical protein ACEQ8H_000602, partial [Pleosporales sp. CAS-2024a]